MMSVELLPTANLLAPTSENLLGAAQKAVMFSAVNVALGFGVGFFLLRYLYRRDRSNRVWTSALLPLGLGGGVLYNITLGFVRQSAQMARVRMEAGNHGPAPELDIVKELYRAFEVLMGRSTEHQPLSSESFILIALGFVVFAVAIYKGFSQKDPYPGFQEQFMRLKEAEERYFFFREPIDLRLGELIDELREKVNSPSVHSKLDNNASETSVEPQDMLKLILWQEAYVADFLDIPLYMPSEAAPETATA